jgi:hypothetical protein
MGKTSQILLLTEIMNFTYMCVKNGGAKTGSGTRCGSGKYFVDTVFVIFYFNTGARMDVAAPEHHDFFFSAPGSGAR